MRILALDCSTEWCSVAVGDGRRWHWRDEHAGQVHSERVLPMIHAVLAEAGLTLDGLAGIAFGAGPGSFTGIRIGCGIAQGLALGADLPVVPVPTLEALAQQARHLHGWTDVVACLDARMREVYIAMYVAEGDGWRVVIAPDVLPPSALKLPDTARGACGAGGAFAVYPSLGAELSLREVDAEARPAAQAIGELALPRFASGQGVSAGEALPLYVRHRVALTTAERDAGLRL
jgi:tRNA threonylcarbamoyladenosine biosynthesis protein TsaB